MPLFFLLLFCSTPRQSGDIVLIMNTAQGVITVTDVDNLPGWHGAPTNAESVVPMFFSAPGDLPEGIAKILPPPESKNQLRTLDFKGILEQILQLPGGGAARAP